jgi:superfamily II DNA/RNA helicase
MKLIQNLGVLTQRHLLVERPDDVVGTPLRALTHLNARNVGMKHAFEMLVTDEADLMFHLGKRRGERGFKVITI